MSAAPKIKVPNIKVPNIKVPTIRTVPNILTLARLCAVPFFVWCVVKEYWPAAFILLISAGLTDIADGYIARHYNQASRLGSFMDPMADKILGVSAYVSFSLKGVIPAWLGALVFTRDIAISLGALVLVLLDMHVVARPSILGKRTTLAQIVTVSLALLGMFGPQKFYIQDLGILKVFIYATAALTIASGTHYLGMALKEYDQKLLMKPPKEGVTDGP